LIDPDGEAEEPPGRLIASGRAADVFDLGDGTVLRRYRSDHDSGPEGRLMAWLAARGVAVPLVHRADGRDLVMDHVGGPSMLDDLQRRPWRLPRHARTLAALQRSINDVDAPDWLSAGTAGPDGSGIVHGDLHPMNVILGPDGPVVIDFTNATRGPATFDAAMSYLLMSTFETSGAIDRLGQRLLVAAFRRSRGREIVDAGLEAACRFRLADVNVTIGERERVGRLLARVTSDTATSLL
jgi:aminoglycoside phosphotransferase (APT) family kinase protein